MLVALSATLRVILTKLHAGRVAKTPFHSTGEVAARASGPPGETGLLSTEGTVLPPDELLTSPVEGKRCLKYTLEVHARWKVGDRDISVQMIDEKRALVFEIDDGSGPIQINPGTRGDFEPSHTFEQRQRKDLKAGLQGDSLRFGTRGFEVHLGTRHQDIVVPDHAEITVTERVLETSPHLYANGRLKDGVIHPPDHAHLILATQCRDDALAPSRNRQYRATLAAISGGVLALICLGLSLLLSPTAGSATDPNPTTTTEAR